MKNVKPKALQLWHQFVQTGDYKLLDELLAEEVVFPSPVVWKPQKGKEITKIYLSAAAQVLGGEDFVYVREVINDRHYMLEFTKTIDDITINGIDMIEVNENDQIIDFKVMVRPLKGMQKIHQKMGEILMKFKS